MITGDQLSPQDVNFLKTLKAKGVSKDEAFSRLEKVKGGSSASSATPVNSDKYGWSDVVESAKGIIPGAIKGFTEGGAKAQERRGERYQATQDMPDETLVDKAKKGVAQFASNKLAKTEIALGAASGAITGAIEPVVKPIIEEAVKAPAVQKGLELTKEAGAAVFNTLPDEAQESLRNGVALSKEAYDSMTPYQKSFVSSLIGTAGSAVNILAAAEGGVGVKNIAKEGVETAAKVPALAREGMQIAENTGLTQIPGQIVAPLKNAKTKIASKIGETVYNTAEPARMLESIYKIDPTKEIKFEKMTGKRVGDWAIERDIIDTPVKAVNKLVERFDSAKSKLDAGVKLVEGKFGKGNAALQDALDELTTWYANTKNRAKLPKVLELQNKLDKDGLTLAEIQQTKRLLERDVKLGYGQAQNGEKVATATNIDGDLRTFFEKTASEAGFDNLSQLSKEVQGSRFLADELGKKLMKQRTNNYLSLTDQLMILGGAINPTTLLASGLTKVATSKFSMSRIVRALTNGDVKAMKALGDVPEEIIKINNLNKRKAAFKEWADKEGLSVFTGKNQLMLPEGNAIQAPAPSPETMGEVYRKGEMVQNPLTEAERARPKLANQGVVTDAKLIESLSDRQKQAFNAGSKAEQKKALEHLRLKYELEQKQSGLSSKEPY